MDVFAFRRTRQGNYVLSTIDQASCILHSIPPLIVAFALSIKSVDKHWTLPRRRKTEKILTRTFFIFSHQGLQANYQSKAAPHRGDLRN